jgi:hypothetical protein
MPDLDRSATAVWLEAMDRPAVPWPPAFRPIEDEGDGPDLLTDLGARLDRLAEADPGVLSVALRTPPLAGELQVILAQTGTARLFRFLHWLEERQVPDTHLITARLVEGDGPNAAALRAAIAGFTRHRVLRRLFAPDRIAALHTATETALKEPA